MYILIYIAVCFVSFSDCMSLKFGIELHCSFTLLKVIVISEAAE